MVGAASERVGDDEAERYASSLADYTAAEPLPLIDFAIRRGRALAAAGRGDDRAAELAMLRDEALRTGYRIALPAIERAIAGGAPSPPAWLRRLKKKK